MTARVPVGARSSSRAAASRRPKRAPAPAVSTGPRAPAARRGAKPIDATVLVPSDGQRVEAQPGMVKFQRVPVKRVGADVTREGRPRVRNVERVG